MTISPDTLRVLHGRLGLEHSLGSHFLALANFARLSKLMQAEQNFLNYPVRVGFGSFVFNGTETFMGYLMPKPSL